MLANCPQVAAASSLVSADVVKPIAGMRTSTAVRYRSLAEGLFDAPIKTALYLTAMPRLINV